MATNKTNIFVYAHWLGLHEPVLMGVKYQQNLFPLEVKAEENLQSKSLKTYLNNSIEAIGKSQLKFGIFKKCNNFVITNNELSWKFQ
ncbi:MAG TPA: hypothetical protein PKX92_06500 [Edaphocola sp.]|nr:hypothetical protein [Edaphocola sp.]